MTTPSLPAPFNVLAMNCPVETTTWVQRPGTAHRIPAGALGRVVGVHTHTSRDLPPGYIVQFADIGACAVPGDKLRLAQGALTPELATIATRICAEVSPMVAKAIADSAADYLARAAALKRGGGRQAARRYPWEPLPTVVDIAIGLCQQRAHGCLELQALIIDAIRDRVNATALPGDGYTI